MLSSQASTPDGPEMLFYINTASSPTGEKIRALTGLPLINCPDEEKEGVIDSSVEGSKDEPSEGACTDDACRISLRSKLQDSAEGKDGEEKESKSEPKIDEIDSDSQVDDEDEPINMQMMIMDVPNGGEYYRYPCCSELSTIPNTFSPLIVKDSPDIRSWRVSSMKEGKESKKEAKDVLESAVDESKSPSIGSLREYCSRTLGSSIGFPSSLRTPPSASASTITTEASSKGDAYAQTPVFTLSTIDQITRQFISDYQNGKMIK